MYKSDEHRKGYQVRYLLVLMEDHRYFDTRLEFLKYAEEHFTFKGSSAAPWDGLMYPEYKELTYMRDGDKIRYESWEVYEMMS